MDVANYVSMGSSMDFRVVSCYKDLKSSPDSYSVRISTSMWVNFL